MGVQPVDVVRNAFFDAGRGRITCLTHQLGKVGLGEALVLAAQRVGERDVFDEALLEQLVERLRRFAGERAAVLTLATASSLKLCARPVPN